jgi:hypothetical protein
MNLTGWVPSRFLWRATGPRVQWTLLGQQRLLDPFYEQALQRQMAHPFHHLFRRETSIEEMVDWVSSNPPLEPKGLIFHMSRCGSTLIAQMLAACERNVVASEPAPLDGVLRAHFRIRDLATDVQVRWLRAMVGALSQQRAGGEQAFYLKLDCWHVHQIDLIRLAFPNAPLIFVYRNPIEVMVSHARMPAAWTIPGLLHPLVLQLQPEDWDPTKMDAYCAKALASICKGGHHAAQRYGGLLVNYSELPQAMYGRVFDHFRLPGEDIPAMQAKAQRNAKSPHMSFTSDAESKRSEATERLRQVVAQYLLPVYDQLEETRRTQLQATTALS